ncbi:EMBRYO DEFECTIVE 260, EMBRYO DEFECTIVE 2421 [Hibiscus trionum]|uniref:EMBRYO DEFECTIVE 260, EMBRYO DEFECTIVE 2421 n=1 Tax=Hibiscus trionum TaxID=183268 RepID=A0A9W7JI99_HIBTR|nr:EMBRYO DEFECTIVE 260, EMBRYO DEFECTIVE 2421 [Hibiscus trionum]
MGVSGFIKGFNFLHRNKPRIRFHPYGYIQWRNFSDSKILNGHDSLLPVLIVGAGPVGLVLSILLNKFGVKCTVLEKNKGFSKHPQAHFINNRTMEVFRKLDGLAEEIQRSQPPVDLWRKFIYCTSLTGSVLGSVDHMHPKDFEKVVSPISVAHFSQYKLTRKLVKMLENVGFRVHTLEGPEGLDPEPLKGREILMGHECVSIDTTDECVTATVSFYKEGKLLTRKIQSKILIGADGAGSAVRKLVGIELKGEKDLQKLVSVHFWSKELGQYLLYKRPGMLFFIFNTEAIGVLVAHDLTQGEFVLQIPFYPPQQNLEDFSPEICKKLILKMVGQELSDIDVIDIKPWVMHAEVAERYVCGNNQIMLCGDAAHRFPPAGGFGMNTGIQDAHNLAWKIASLLEGVAPSSILATYETERKPVAEFNTALSVQNFRAAMAVPATLGLDPTIANSVHQVINKGVGSILPSGMQKAILDGIFSIGRSQLSGLILNESNPLGSSRLAKLRHIFEEGKSLQLKFPAEDLGFRYLEGALVPDNKDVVSAPELPTGRRRDYVPCADPGSRLPHMNVRVLSNFPSEETISTHDLVSVDKVEFLLIIAPVEESYNLARSAFKAAEEYKVSTKVCVLWPADTVTGSQPGSKAKLAPWKNYTDVIEVKTSSDSLSWWRTCQMTEQGAILVRPDEHIAWRSKSNIVGDTYAKMKMVFSTILGFKSTNIGIEDSKT